MTRKNNYKTISYKPLMQLYNSVTKHTTVISRICTANSRGNHTVFLLYTMDRPRIDVVNSGDDNQGGKQ